MKTRVGALLVALLVVPLVAGGAFAQEVPPSSDPVFVSIVSLIATPEKFHGREVIVRGWARVEEEDSAIYYSPDHMRASIQTDAVWLRFGEEFVKSARPEALHGRAVMVRGTFGKDQHGMGMSPGTILVTKAWFDDVRDGPLPVVSIPRGKAHSGARLWL